MWLSLGTVDVGSIVVGDVGVVIGVGPGGNPMVDGTPTRMGGKPEGVVVAEWAATPPFDGAPTVATGAAAAVTVTGTVTGIVAVVAATVGGQSPTDLARTAARVPGAAPTATGFALGPVAVAAKTNSPTTPATATKTPTRLVQDFMSPPQFSDCSDAEGLIGECGEDREESL